MDCKATVNLGEFARGGKTRGPNQALDPDFGSLRDLEQQETRLIQLKIDNGPESSGIRTQFLKRIVDFSNEIGRPIQLLCYPPYHSKYNPIARCWGILGQHWNGTLLQDIQTLLGWAQSMTWKGIHPKVWLSSKTY